MHQMGARVSEGRWREFLRALVALRSTSLYALFCFSSIFRLIQNLLDLQKLSTRRHLVGRVHVYVRHLGTRDATRKKGTLDHMHCKNENAKKGGAPATNRPTPPSTGAASCLGSQSRPPPPVAPPAVRVAGRWSQRGLLASATRATRRKQQMPMTLTKRTPQTQRDEDATRQKQTKKRSQSR
jgi:hypothetical protein